MRNSILLICFLILTITAKAQNNISVASFRLAENDLTANLQGTQVLDQNGNTCALIKVETTQTGFAFDVGIMGITKVVQHTAEIWVYVPFGVKHITIQHQQLGTLRDYYFPCPIQEARTYIMQLTTGKVTTVVEENLGGSFLVMNVSPANAMVSVDGNMQENTDGTVTVWLEYGNHNYRVEAPNHETEVGAVQIGKEKKRMEVKLQSSQASLTISCTDKEAEIYINDKKYGVGSCSCALNAGSYLVEARKQGHRAEKQPLVLGKKEQKTIVLNAPVPVYGKLKLTSTPADCNVYLDGKLIGTSPDVFADILEGPHNVELRKEGYENTSKQVTIEEGKAASLNIELKKGNALAQQAQQPNDTPTDSILSFTVNGVTFKMIYVEGGTFTMGATAEQGRKAERDEKPAHSVTLSSYYMGETEVTQALWQAVMGSNPSYFNGSNLPVECVSWNDCQEFITKLNQLCASQLNGRQFALPTEAQWEYAARGGKQSQGYKYSGSNTLDNVAWYRDNSGNYSWFYGNIYHTHTVGTKQANELGLYDMSGNVREWCQDWFDSNYYSYSSQTNPTGPATGSRRVNRGVGCSSSAELCRVSYRGYDGPGKAYFTLGLRLALR